MGKKGGNKRKFKNNSQGQDGRKQFKGDNDGFTEFGFNHPIFEAYYREQFESTYFSEDKEEFNIFWSALKEKLPVVFRINKQTPNYQVFLNHIKDKDFLNTFVESKRKEIANKAKEAESIKPEEKDVTDGKAEENEVEEEREKENNQDQSQSQEEDNGAVEDVPEEKINKRAPRFEFSDAELANMKISNIGFYPDELVWQVNCNRTQLRKSALLKGFHQYLQRATDAGLVSRQELVSMIPPLLLDVESDDVVFDMCAAPGSKTAQLLELMHAKGGINSKGAVIANDVDQKRAYLLTHQVCRINPSGLVVINHPAQFFPRLKDGKGNKFYFDRIQADVPCSGDGATRKIPTQWKNWNTRDGQVLHPLQLAILQRALTLCKVGGCVIYSTCSINPIEDEAVIAEAFRRATPGSLELIDIHNKLPGLKGRRGLSSWKVGCSLKKHPGNDYGTEGVSDWLKFYDNMEQVDQADKSTKFMRQSLFPDTAEKMINEIKIQNTMRILPHDQDTGGFYLALIKKTSLITWSKTGSKINPNADQQTAQKNEEIQEETQDKDQEDDEMPDASEIPQEAEKLQNLELEGEAEEKTKTKDKEAVLKEKFVALSDADWENIQQNYGLEGIEQSLLVCSVTGKQNLVRLITPGARAFNDFDIKGVVNTVNMGTKAFERTKETFQGLQCKFRICQDSVNLIAPFMTKRKLQISEDDFKFFIDNKNAKYTEIQNEELKEKVIQLGQGSIVLHCPTYNDYLVCQNFHQSVNIMIGKEITESFKIRFLDNVL